VVVTLSHGGYAKAQPVSDYQAQRRGGRGKAAHQRQDEDFVDKLFRGEYPRHAAVFLRPRQALTAESVSTAAGEPRSRGKPIVNLLPLQEGERISAMLSIKDFEEGKFVFMATSLGTVRRLRWRCFRGRGRAASLPSRSIRGTSLVGVAITDGTKDILLFHDRRQAFASGGEVRAMGREAAGVRGVKLNRRAARECTDRGGAGVHFDGVRRNGFGKLTPSTIFRSTGAAARASSLCRSPTAMGGWWERCKSVRMMKSCS